MSCWDQVGVGVQKNQGWSNLKLSKDSRNVKGGNCKMLKYGEDKYFLKLQLKSTDNKWCKKQKETKGAKKIAKETMGCKRSVRLETHQFKSKWGVIEDQ